MRAWAAADPSVIVTGFVEDVRPWMAEAAVYLCPIRDGGGTRIKLLDAMAMGLPIVSHDMAIEGLEVEPGRHLLVARDAEGLAAGVERVLREPALAAALGQAARERAVVAVLDRGRFGPSSRGLPAVPRARSGRHERQRASRLEAVR